MDKVGCKHCKELFHPKGIHNHMKACGKMLRGDKVSKTNVTYTVTPTSERSELTNVDWKELAKFYKDTLSKALALLEKN